MWYLSPTKQLALTYPAVGLTLCNSRLTPNRPKKTGFFLITASASVGTIRIYFDAITVWFAVRKVESWKLVMLLVQYLFCAGFLLLPPEDAVSSNIVVHKFTATPDSYV